MRKILVILLVAILLSSCAPTEADIQRAVSQTQTAAPTPTVTPTPIPLSKLNVDEMIFVEGDLPSGTEVDPIFRYSDNEILSGITGYEQMVGRQFRRTNHGLGLAVMMLFSTEEGQKNAIRIVGSKVVEPPLNLSQQGSVSGLGEESASFHKTFMGIGIGAVAFRRCGAFVYISKTVDDANLSELVPYAKNIDKRVSSLLCNR